MFKKEVGRKNPEFLKTTLTEPQKESVTGHCIFVCASWQQRQKEVECGNGEGSLPYVH
jgi:hypothetical protein